MSNEQDGTEQWPEQEPEPYQPPPSPPRRINVNDALKWVVILGAATVLLWDVANRSLGMRELEDRIASLERANLSGRSVQSGETPEEAIAAIKKLTLIQSGAIDTCLDMLAKHNKLIYRHMREAH